MGGKDRSCGVVIAYLVKKFAGTPQEAINFIRTKRTIVTADEYTKPGEYMDVLQTYFEREAELKEAAEVEAKAIAEAEAKEAAEAEAKEAADAESVKIATVEDAIAVMGLDESDLTVSMVAEIQTAVLQDAVENDKEAAAEAKAIAEAELKEAAEAEAKAIAEAEAKAAAEAEAKAI